MKVRLTITTTYEFEPNMEFYPEGSTIEDVLRLEKYSAELDPYMFMHSEKSNTEVKTEIIGD